MENVGKGIDQMLNGLRNFPRVAPKIRFIIKLENFGAHRFNILVLWAIRCMMKWI